MGDNWDEEDYSRYMKRYRYIWNNYDIIHGFKLKWYQKLRIKLLYWWLLKRKIYWR